MLRCHSPHWHIIVTAGFTITSFIVRSLHCIANVASFPSPSRTLNVMVGNATSSFDGSVEATIHWPTPFPHRRIETHARRWEQLCNSCIWQLWNCTVKCKCHLRWLFRISCVFTEGVLLFLAIIWLLSSICRWFSLGGWRLGCYDFSHAQHTQRSECPAFMGTLYSSIEQCSYESNTGMR